MNMTKALELLREQIRKIDDLKKPPSYNPEYKIWNNTTIKILEEAFSPDLVRMFQTAGGGSFTTSTQDRYRVYIQQLEEKKQFLEGFIREQERFAGTGEAVVAGARPLGTYQLHPEIAKVSGKLLDDGHFAPAVEEAFKRVINEVKAIMIQKEQPVPLSEDSLIGHAFGMENRTPNIKFNPLSNTEERDEQRGIMYLFKGVVGIRNRKAHQNVILDSPERAVEYLGLASLLMRLLDLSQKFDKP
jgi:uncharacterized protein (TIGR02391 family)